MAAVTTSANAALYKRWYENRRNVLDTTYPNAPLWAMLPKREDFTGAALGVAIITDGPVGGRSATFSNAQSNKTAGSESQFLITRVKDYGLISIEQEAILASKDDKGAFLKMARLKTDQTLKTLTHNLSVALYGNGGGARGQVGSTSTTTLTLKDTNDVVNFASFVSNICNTRQRGSERISFSSISSNCCAAVVTEITSLPPESVYTFSIRCRTCAATPVSPPQ